MKLLITGSRHFKDRRLMHRVLADFLTDGYTVLIHGGARGADTLAEEVGRKMGFKIEAYPVRVEIDGPWPGAGVNRNSRMLHDSKPDYAVAFPLSGSKGTWDMVKKLKAAGIGCDIIDKVWGDSDEKHQ